MVEIGLYVFWSVYEHIHTYVYVCIILSGFICHLSTIHNTSLIHERVKDAFHCVVTCDPHNNIRIYVTIIDFPI